MTTEEIISNSEPYILRRNHVDIPNISIDYKNVRNESKHKESCLKARKKRKSKKRRK